MAASNESSHPRKRIATYGKSVRKWPQVQVAFKTFQEFDGIPGAPTQIRNPTTNARITGENDSLSSSSPSLATAYDVSASSDEGKRKPNKKRKIAHHSGDDNEPSVGSLEQDGQAVRHLSGRYTGVDPIAQRSSQHILRADQDSQQHSHERRAETQLSTTKIFTARHEMLRQSSPRPLYKGPQAAQYSLSGRKPTKSKPSPKSQQGNVHASPSPTQFHLSTTGVHPSNTDSAFTLDDTEGDTDSEPKYSAILTPRGTKMWNNLLGDNSDNALLGQESLSRIDRTIGEYDNDERSRNRRQRRLIDSLAGESNSDNSLLDLYPNLEEQDSTVSTPQKFPRALDEQSTAPDRATAFVTPDTKPALAKAAGGGRSSQPLRSKVIYGRQRSMLAEQDPTDGIVFHVPLEEAILPPKIRSRKNSVSAMPGLNGFVESHEAESEKVGVAIRTIHELRQAGAESRFKDELEDLLDRIGSPAQRKSGRRSGLIELAGKMRDKPFSTKFITNGVDQQLFIDIGGELDVISGFIVVLLLILVLDGGIVVSQLRLQGVARLFARLLRFQESILIIAGRRKSNMSKSAQDMLSDLHAYFLDLRLWDDIRPSYISPRTASLRCLDLIVRRSREAGYQVDVVSEELITQIFGILKPFTSSLPAGTDAINFQLAIFTLESHSLQPTTGFDEHVSTLKSILEWRLKAASGDPVIPVLLRLVLNTTNKSSTVSDAFASSDLLRLLSLAVIERFKSLSEFVAEEERLSLINQLVLELIVMINIVELSDRARRCFLEIQDSSLDDLVRIFEENITKAFEADSVEDSHLNVAGGYLAVLLGYLALSPEVWQRIAVAQRTPTLQPLIACIDEFISHHKKVDDLLNEEGESTPKAGLTDRLQGLVDMLKARQTLR